MKCHQLWPEYCPHLGKHRPNAWKCSFSAYIISYPVGADLCELVVNEYPSMHFASTRGKDGGYEPVSTLFSVLFPSEIDVNIIMHTKQLVQLIFIFTFNFFSTYSLLNSGRHVNLSPKIQFAV